MNAQYVSTTVDNLGKTWIPTIGNFIGWIFLIGSFVYTAQNYEVNDKAFYTIVAGGLLTLFTFILLLIYFFMFFFSNKEALVWYQYFRIFKILFLIPFVNIVCIFFIIDMKKHVNDTLLEEAKKKTGLDKPFGAY